MLRNRFFLARAYGPVRGLDLEALLEISDAEFQAFDGALEDSDDDARVLVIPLVEVDGFTWELEYFDNGEDVGITHRIVSPGGDDDDERPLTFATVDAHASGHSLRWSEAVLIAGDDSTRLLPLWPVVNLDESDDKQAVERALAAAWMASQLVSRDVADQIAVASVRSRKPGKLRKRPPLVAELLAALAAR